MAIVHCDPWASQVHTIRIRQSKTSPDCITLVFEGGWRGEDEETFDFNVWGQGYGAERNPPVVIDERPDAPKPLAEAIADGDGEFDGE